MANLCEAVDKTVRAHRDELRADRHEDADPSPEMTVAGEVAPEQAASPADQAVVEGTLVVRTRERYAAVQALRERGRSITAIGRDLGLDRPPLRPRRTRRGPAVTTQSRESVLDAFKPYLHERFNAGHTDAAALTLEITALGYRGSDKTVRRYLQPYRASLTAPAPVPLAPSVRKVTGWLTRRPDTLNEDERVLRLELKTILDRSPTLATTAVQVREFAQMLTARHPERLPNWMSDVQDNGAPALRSFANRLRSDLDAVTAGLTCPTAPAPSRAQSNRIKTIKRQTYGRARFDLLRKRILNPA